jgi:hypothetical protein
MRRALEIDEANYGLDHPGVVTDLNNLAGLLQTTNRLAEAEPLIGRAFVIFLASLGLDQPNTQTIFQTTERCFKIRASHKMPSKPNSPPSSSKTNLLTHQKAPAMHRGHFPNSSRGHQPEAITPSGSAAPKTLPQGWIGRCR